MSEITVPENIDRLPFPEKLKTLAALAAQADPEFRVFGADKHKYAFASPLGFNDIRSFERRTGITLPPEYLQFLLYVGNGGAGVDYGMYPLEKAEAFSVSENVMTEGPTLFDFDNYADVYLEKTKKLEELDGVSGDEANAICEKLESDITRGMFIIGTAGCTYDYFIMLTGRKKGMVGSIDWNLISEPNEVPIMYDMTLSEWLEDHFRRIIEGRLIKRGTFSSVDYFSDTGRKMRARRMEPSPPKPAEEKPAPAAEPAAPEQRAVPEMPEAGLSESALPPPSTPLSPPPPSPPPPPPKRVFRAGDFITHARYGSGIITNVVGNIITADYISCGSKSLILPYDEKDILG